MFKKDEWLIIPVYRIFGSEELSSVSSCNYPKEFRNHLYLLNQKDADKSGVKEGDLIQLEISETRIKDKSKN